MTIPPRLHLDAPLAAGGVAPLGEGQHHYVRNVMRRAEGDALIVFNARDGEFSGRLETLTKKTGAVRLGARLRGPKPEPDLWLLFAPVKRAAMETIVQKATELGASRLQPVVTVRTNAARVKDERLAAIAVEAAEQCGRLSVPAVAPSVRLSALLNDWESPRRLLYCDEAGDDPDASWGGESGRAPPLLDALAGAPADPWAVLIGPEGGFTPEERAALRAAPFVTPASLGPRILRADTAAIAALTLFQAACGDWRGGAPCGPLKAS